jgi:hypothetical protein
MTERWSGFAYGVPVSFSVEEDARELAAELLPPDWSPGEAPADTPCWALESPETAPAQINAAELYIAERAPDLIFIHAGCVAFDGAAILLPGRSFTGKSSLTDALVRAGGAYYSDEFALLRPDGDVLPYPRPLALRGRDGTPARRISPSEMATVGSGPTVVGVVAALTYAADGRWSTQEGSVAEGALALIDNAVAAQTRPDEVLTACAATMSSGRFLRGVRGDADDAAQRLIRFLEER